MEQLNSIQGLIVLIIPLNQQGDNWMQSRINQSFLLEIVMKEELSIVLRSFPNGTIFSVSRGSNVGGGGIKTGSVESVINFIEESFNGASKVIVINAIYDKSYIAGISVKNDWTVKVRNFKG